MGLNRLLRLSDSTDGAQKIEEEKTVKGGWKGGGGVQVETEKERRCFHSSSFSSFFSSFFLYSSFRATL